MIINRYEELQATLRNWKSFKDQDVYDLNGIVALAIACFDNIQLNIIETDYEEIRDCFTDEQKLFLKNFAKNL